jgi:hypothetical protein
MFPDGGMYANMPDFGQCVITLSQEEMDAAARVNVERASSSHVHRCEQVLSKLLLSLAHSNNGGFRGLPIDVFFNPDDGSDSNASHLTLKFTGWPNVKRMYPSPQHGIMQDVLMPPYLPNHCDNFNPIANADDERAALQVSHCRPSRLQHPPQFLTRCCRRTPTLRAPCLISPSGRSVTTSR